MGSRFRRRLGVLVLIRTTSCARLVCYKVVGPKPDHSPTTCYSHARWPSAMQTHTPLRTSTPGWAVRPNPPNPPQRTGLSLFLALTLICTLSPNHYVHHKRFRTTAHTFPPNVYRSNIIQVPYYTTHAQSTLLVQKLTALNMLVNIIPLMLVNSLVEQLSPL